MVDHQNPQLDLAFGALSDRTRRAILFQIAKKDATVTELAEPHDMTVAAVSKHLMVLERAGLITKAREGRTLRCRLNPVSFQSVTDLLERLATFWTDNLDSLESYFQNKNAKGSDLHEKPGKSSAAPARHQKNHSRKTKRGV